MRERKEGERMREGGWVRERERMRDGERKGGEKITIWTK